MLNTVQVCITDYCERGFLKIFSTADNF